MSKIMSLAMAIGMFFNPDATEQDRSDAFAVIVATYRQKVIRFAERELNDDKAEAEDITQEAFMTVFSCMSKFRYSSGPEGEVARAFQSWLFGHVRNHLREHWRKRSYRKEFAHRITEPDMVDDDMDRKIILLQDIRSRLQRARPEDRQVLAAHYLMDCEDELEGPMTDREKDAHYKRLSRARKNLRAMWGLGIAEL